MLSVTLFTVIFMLSLLFKMNNNQNRWHYLSAHWLYGDVLLSNITFSILAVLVVQCRPYKLF